FAVERCCRFFRSAQALQPRIVEENSIPLAAFHHKQCRPLLVETASLAIDETRDCLRLCSACRHSSRQGLSQYQASATHTEHQANIEGDPANVVSVCNWLPKISTRDRRADIAGLPV